MREDLQVPGIIASADISAKFIVSRLAPLPGEFENQSHQAQIPAMEQFWGERTERLLREAFSNFDSAAFHAVVRNFLSEEKNSEAASLLEEAAGLGVTSPALERATIQLWCRTEPLRALAYLTASGVSASINIDDPEFLIDIARAFAATDDSTNAKHFISRALSFRPSVRQLGTVAETLWQLRDEGGSWTAAQLALRAEPNNVRALNVAACCRVHNLRFDEAAEAFERALSIDPLYRPALLNQLIFFANYLGEWPGTERLKDYVLACPADLGFSLRVAAYAEKFHKTKFVDFISEQLERRFPENDVTGRVIIMRYARYAEQRAALGPREYARRLEIVVRRIVSDHHGALLDAAVLVFALLHQDELRNNAQLFGAFDKLDEKSRNTPSLHAAVIGLRSYSEGKLGEGISQLEHANKLDPRNGALVRILAWRHIDYGEDYGRASDLCGQLIDSDMSTLVDWNSAIYADLMSDRIEEAAEKWATVSKRPAWQSALNATYTVRATHGLLLIKQGDLDGGANEYAAALTYVSDELVRARIRQKLNLEIGRFLQRQGRPDGKRFLTASIGGPDLNYTREAEKCLLRNPAE